jgi:glycosyltransferase involved in cell wall biosynthesis
MQRETIPSPPSDSVRPPETKRRATRGTEQRYRVALIPAYNEERFIGSVVLQTRRYVDHVVVIDDGSSDATEMIARAAGAEVLKLPGNVGKAEAVTQGLSYLRRLKPTAVVMLDGDGQHSPRDIPLLLAPIESGAADIVIGSRFKEVRSQIPRWRVLGQHTLTVATNVTSGVYTTDSQSGFRAFHPDTLPVLAFTARGFSIESEMQFIARENQLRVQEVPIAVVYAEPAKRNPVLHGMQVLNGILRLVGQTRPLFFFGLPGLIGLLAGLLLGGWVVHIYQLTRQLAIGYTLLAVLLCIVGTIGVATGIILHSVRALLLDWRQREAARAD